MGEESYLKKEVRYYQNGESDFYAVMRGHEKADLIEVSEEGVKPYQERVDIREFCGQHGITQAYKNAQIYVDDAKRLIEKSKENPREASKLVKEIHQNKIDNGNVVVDRWQLIQDREKSKENPNYRNFREPKIYEQNDSR